MKEEPKRYSEIREVVDNDPYVNSIVKKGGTLEMCVVFLANQKNELLRRVIELESIAPKAYRQADGKVLVWRCPDDLIPITELPEDSPK